MPEKLKPETYLSVQIRHHVGGLKIDVDFKLTKPWTILFGPSGSGKTTILRVIAGLLRPDEGRIVATTMHGTAQEEGVALVDTGAGVFVAAHKRRIRLATQQPNLFPHMTVIENIGYGVPSAFDQDSDCLKAERQTLEDFGLGDAAERLPNQLSGGEAQRANLARAVAATESRLLLLDEPFTGMDAMRRDQMLPLLKDKLAKSFTPVLSVTHDVAEAFQLGAEVIKLAEGCVVDQGPVEVVLAEERAQLLRQLND